MALLYSVQLITKYEELSIEFNADDSDRIHTRSKQNCHTVVKSSVWVKMGFNPWDYFREWDNSTFLLK